MPNAEYPFDLGGFHRPASTRSDQAQAWFDRGLIWSYAFNHEEAIACFERAIADDEHFAPLGLRLLRRPTLSPLVPLLLILINLSELVKNAWSLDSKRHSR